MTLGEISLFDVVVDDAGEGGAKTSQVRSAIDGVDVVNKRKSLFCVGIVVLKRHLNHIVIFGLGKINGIGMQCLFVRIQKFNEFQDSALIMKLVFFVVAFICD